MNLSGPLSLIVSVLGVALTFLLYYLPSILGKRMSWVRLRRGKHYWFLLFNTSRRIITKEDVYKNLFFERIGIHNCEIVSKSGVDSADLIPAEEKIDIAFECMEPKAFIVIELQTLSVKPRPELKGYLKDGDIRRWFEKPTVGFSLVSHTYFFELLISFIMGVAAGVITYTSYHYSGRDIGWIVWLVSTVLGLVFSLVIHFCRRVPTPVYKKALKSVSEKVWPIIRRIIRIVNNQCRLLVLEALAAVPYSIRCFGIAFGDIWRGNK